MTDQSSKPIAAKAELAISKGWVQGVALVMVFGFLVMGVLAARTYSDSMPLPQRVVGPDGQTLYTEQQITSGQQIFLRRGTAGVRLGDGPRRLPRPGLHRGVPAAVRRSRR